MPRTASGHSGDTGESPNLDTSATSCPQQELEARKNYVGLVKTPTSFLFLKRPFRNMCIVSSLIYVGRGKADLSTNKTSLSKNKTNNNNKTTLHKKCKSLPPPRTLLSAALEGGGGGPWISCPSCLAGSRALEGLPLLRGHQQAQEAKHGK